MNVNFDELIESEKFRRIFLPVATVFLVVLFASLGLWQLDRAAEKNRVRALFEDGAAYVRLQPDMPIVEFQTIETDGQFLTQRQFLVDNVIVDGRIGSYVLTPLRRTANDPLLLVNRGWIARTGADRSKPQVDVAERPRNVRGRVGFLPKIGVRSGQAFRANDDWPKLARYPTLEELSSELGSELLPFVLLLDPAADDGFTRRWQPRDRGPMMHYGYALQWFAMAAAVAGVFVWKRRKKAG